MYMILQCHRWLQLCSHETPSSGSTILWEKRVSTILASKVLFWAVLVPKAVWALFPWKLKYQKVVTLRTQINTNNPTHNMNYCLGLLETSVSIWNNILHGDLDSSIMKQYKMYRCSLVLVKLLCRYSNSNNIIVKIFILHYNRQGEHFNGSTLGPRNYRFESKF